MDSTHIFKKTQFGFRKRKSTADAIHIVRRIIDESVATNPDKLKTYLLLLDWETAFDKVHHEAVFEALKRMKVPEVLITAIKSLYKEPQFMVEQHDIRSQWYCQQRGIRQGCPLSPYLFLVLVTVMFHDVYSEHELNTAIHRPMGIQYDMVLYADGTTCISQNTRALNKLLAAIEIEGQRIGLRLNEDKCEVMYRGTESNIHFRDETPVRRSREVKYLGALLSETGDMKQEIRKRIAEVMIVFNNVHPFMVRCRCSQKWKLIVFNAVIRSKLLYGLDSAQLNDPLLTKINTFCLKGLRKILKMPTTYAEMIGEGWEYYRLTGHRQFDKNYVYGFAKKVQNKNRKGKGKGQN